MNLNTSNASNNIELSWIPNHGAIENEGDKQHLSVKQQPDIHQPNLSTNSTITLHSPRKYVTKVTKLTFNESPTIYPIRTTNVTPVKSIDAFESQTDEISPNVNQTCEENLSKEFEIKKKDREQIGQEFQKYLNEHRRISAVISEVHEKEIVETEKNKITEEKPMLEEKEINKKEVKDNKITKIENKETKTFLTQLILPTKITPKKKYPKRTPIKETVTTPTKKIRNYDPKIAREYIKEQQNKRKQTNEKSKLGDKFEKKEIQKRLEELRSTTLNLLNKNVKSKKKEEKEPKSSEKPLKCSRKMNFVHNVVERTPIAVVKKRDSSTEILKETPKLIDKKKIGILRKTDEIRKVVKKQLKEKPVLNITSPKTPTNAIPTQTEVDGSPKFYDSLEILPDPVETVPHLKVLKTNSIPTQTSIQISSTVSHHNEEDDVNLKIPDVTLKTTNSFTEKNQQQDIPYWLKPSGVQIYPYNFIMAIRKKIESITNPKLNTKENYNHKSTSSELNTNFSSISIHVPESNTASEVSSIRSESNKNNTRKILTSTKLDNIERKKSESDLDTTLKSSISSINEEIKCSIMKEDEICPLSKEAINDMRIYTNRDGAKEELSNSDFYKLLESFNKSLNHVIEVNKQLYSTLQNPPESIQLKNEIQINKALIANQNTQTSPVLMIASEKSEPEYSDSFEKNSDLETVVTTSIPNEIDVIEKTIIPIISNKNSPKPNNNEEELNNETVQNNNNNNTTLGSDIFSYFNDIDDTSDVNLSIFNLNNSDSNLNYSKLGIYDQMIKNEKVKSDQLLSFMKIREKILIDRTKGQIAWLELQKKKFKEQGKYKEISTIKKKQRAILVRLENDRQSLQRLLKDNENQNKLKTKITNLTESYFKIKDTSSSSSVVNNISFNRKSNISISGEMSTNAIKGYDLKGGANLNRLLQKRETELTKRRDNVKSLLDWHKRLDKEEKEVLELEKQLYEFNLNKINLKQPEIKNNNKKIKKIETSLQLLRNIPTNENEKPGCSDYNPKNHINESIVQISGIKLNKLWYRLTGRKELKFIETKTYEITKSQLEDLYIEAKRVVLEENEIMNLLEISNKILEKNSSKSETENVTRTDESATKSFEFESRISVIDNLNLKKDNSTSDYHKSSNELFIEIPDTTTTIHESFEESLHETFRKPEHLFDNLNEEMSITEINTIPVDSEIKENQSNEDISLQMEKTYTVPTTSSDLLNDESNDTIKELENMLDYSNQSFIEDVSFPTYNEINNTSAVIIVNDFEDNNIIKNNDNDNAILLSDKSDKTLTYNNTFDDETASKIAEEILESPESSSSVVISTNKTIENEIEKRLIRLDESLKDLDRSFEKIPMELKSPELLSPRSTSRSGSEERDIKEMESLILTRNKNINESFPICNGSGIIMPDIINEAEVLRRQNNHTPENESKHLAVDSTINNSTPLLYLREIPNKPPPPYVPPAHGSQFTSVFPSEDRIIEIVLRRTKELYETEFLEKIASTTINDEESILNENITNVYERIILDVCKEAICQMKIPKMTKSYETIPFFKNNLQFYNPPNRLEAIQQTILQKIRKLFYVENQGVRPQAHTFVQGTNKRKRDLVDEILITELNEDESWWTTFDLEETEVKNKITTEILNILVDEALNDFEEIYNRKMVKCT